MVTQNRETILLPRNYQLKRTQYRLPHVVYHNTLWTIKSYFYYKERINDIILETPEHDGQPRGSGVSDPTYAKAVKIEKYANIVHVIEEEHQAIQEEYRVGVWRNVVYGERFPDDAHWTTYSRHKSKFVYNVAVRLDFL